MNTKMVRLLSSVVAVAVACVIFFVGGGVGCPGPNESVTVTADLVLPDGTAKELTDAPLARTVLVRITYSQAVDPTRAEALFGFSANGRAVPGTITWNDDINDDGVMDLFPAAYGFDGGADTGQGYLFLGGSSLASQSAGAASVIITGENALDRFGM